ncbi:hypothetical protein E1301_Tti015896 [Triplophysa tibetana]|uniref:Uncharacterized protein n=1 Tax=Triplophysa tibetana TaxID=1572043 RepID=A0A5A9PF72_9TELE|nr:hypothetical protein E1301_Tti015896 [Triplophysa tibetana]
MARCTCKDAPRKPHKVSRKLQQYKAEGVKCLIHFCSREMEREEKEGWRGGKKKRQRSSPATCHIPRQESSQRKEPFLQEATAAQESLLNPLRWREPARLTRGFQSGMKPRPCPLSLKKENEAELIKEQVLPTAEANFLTADSTHLRPSGGGGFGEEALQAFYRWFPNYTFITPPPPTPPSRFSPPPFPFLTTPPPPPHLAIRGRGTSRAFFLNGVTCLCLTPHKTPPNQKHSGPFIPALGQSAAGGKRGRSVTNRSPVLHHWAPGAASEKEERMGTRCQPPQFCISLDFSGMSQRQSDSLDALRKRSMTSPPSRRVCAILWRADA